MKNIIEVKNLKKYYGEIKAVDDISFEVGEGSLFAFLGENGAGKSTTINVLCTVLQKTDGKVMINGYDLDKQEQNIRNSIGIVFQNSVLDEVLTVKENLESRASYYGIFGNQLKKKMEELTKILNLEEITNRKYGTLSGGQRRRVDIARALINNPKILFLDEPTTGLDPKTRVLVWEIINRLQKENNLTVFLTTHYMEEASEADEVVILEKGKIVAKDTPSNLKSKYSQNRFVWYHENDSKSQELLKKYNLEFEYLHNAYYVRLNANKDIINFLEKEKDYVLDYELIKGNMDDVFLNVTGKKIGD